MSLTMHANGQPEAFAAQIVSGNYFEVLGIKVPFGRGFTPDDDRIGAPARVAVMSHALWQRVLHSDQSLIGETQWLTESVLLGLSGSIGALLVTHVGTPL